MPGVGRESCGDEGGQHRAGLPGFGVSETCFRYSPKRDAENEFIADLLEGLTKAHRTWGFGLCFLQMRKVQGHHWNHKHVDRIYCELEPNLRTKPRRRIKRDKPAQRHRLRHAEQSRGGILRKLER